MKSYSKIDKIALNNASNEIIDGTLILEGGAFRGVYTSGVLDCLIDYNINLKRCIGISAGALNACNYVAGNRGRSAFINLKYRRNHNYVGIIPYLNNGSVIGFNFLFNTCDKEYPLNKERLFSNDRDLYVGATSIETGKIEYFSNHNKDIFFDAARASASMPYVSKPVKINNKLYLDGGSSNKLPIKFALDNNFNKPIVVLTRPYGYRRKEHSSSLNKLFYKKYQNFYEALNNANKIYNEDSKLIENLAKENKILLITPSKYIKVSRLEKDMEKLGSLYELGYEDCKKQITRIKEYLKIN